MSQGMKGKNGSKFVAKLALSPNGDAGPFRRIGLGNFVGSHKKLCEAAAELAAANSPETRVIQYKLRLTFKDEDGDACLLLNDADVRMAFGEAANKPLKIVAEILELSSIQQQGAAAKKQPPVTDASPSPAAVARYPPDTEVPSVQTRTKPKVQGPGENHHPGLHQAVESIVGVLANAVIGLQQATTEPFVADNQDAATPVAATAQDRSVPMGTTETNGSGNNEEEEETEEEKRKFIHGRHTCDSCLTTPIVGKRFHAVNMADYDLCANCFGNYTGEDIQFEQAELDRDRPMQERWHRRYAKWGTAGRPHARKHGGHRSFAPRGRCGPRGPRGGFAGPPPFAPPPHVHPHAPWTPPAFAQQPGSSASTPGQEAMRPNVGDVDAALKEAIRRSMEDMKNAQTQTEAKPTNSEGVQTEAAPEPEIIVEPHQVAQDKEPDLMVFETAQAAEDKEPEIIVDEVAEDSTDNVKPAPTTNLPEESFVDPDAGETALALGDVMDKIASAIRGMSDELERESSQDTNNDSDDDEEKGVTESVGENPDDEKAGAVIISDDLNEDEISQNSWDVVEEEDQAAHDESLARAAFAIGSALYESDISASRANSNGNNPTGAESIESVPTTLPSLASEVPLPTILLQKWHVQVEKLHELGFYNDALTIETLERLEAANIGCDESGEISVTRLVNEMMKDM